MRKYKVMLIFIHMAQWLIMVMVEGINKEKNCWTSV